MATHFDLVSRSDSIDELQRQLEVSASVGRATGVVTLRLRNLGQLHQLHGYAVGVEFMSQCESLIADALRSADSFLRISETTFAVILPRLTSQGQLLLALQKLCRVMSRAIDIDGQKLLPRIRLGAALSTDGVGSPQELLLESERALAAAETRGEQFAIYSAHGEADETWDIEQELRRALEDGDTELRYQPKVDLEAERTVGAEALIRWHHEKKGWVSPELFVPVAEKTGLIDRLTWSVVNTVLERLSRSTDAFRDLSVAVNISPLVLHSGEFLDTLTQAIGIWNRSPSDLVLEVTETAAMADPAVTHAILREARAAGFGIAIDDFGSGYSSLGYLKNLPAHELKIDKQFVVNMARDESDRHIVEATLDLAARFGFQVVAEGIEDRETAELARSLGCRYGQGYYFSEPLDSEELAALLKK